MLIQAVLSFLLADKKIMHDTMQKVLEDRRNNPPQGSERLFIDALLESDMPEETQKNDMIAVLIGGFHTTGLCEWKFMLKVQNSKLKLMLHFGKTLYAGNEMMIQNGDKPKALSETKSNPWQTVLIPDITIQDICFS